MENEVHGMEYRSQKIHPTQHTTADQVARTLYWEMNLFLANGARRQHLEMCPHNEENPRQNFFLPQTLAPNRLQNEKMMWKSTKFPEENIGGKSELGLHDELLATTLKPCSMKEGRICMWRLRKGFLNPVICGVGTRCGSPLGTLTFYI